MQFPAFNIRDAHWETQPWAMGLPACYLLKIPGQPYPFGSIVQTGAPMNPVYECKAFVCDESGRQVTFWIGEETCLTAAEKAVTLAHGDAIEVAA